MVLSVKEIEYHKKLKSLKSKEMSKQKESQYLKEAKIALTRASFEKYKDVFNKFLFGKEIKLPSLGLLPNFVNLCASNIDKDDTSEIEECDIDNMRIDDLTNNNARIIEDIKVYGREQQRKLLYLHASYDNYVVNNFNHILLFYVRSTDFDANTIRLFVDGIQSFSEPKLFVGTINGRK